MFANRCMDMNDMSKMETHKEYYNDGYQKGMKPMEMGHDCGCAMPMAGMGYGAGCCGMPMPMSGMACQPVYECPQERCCHREIVYEVPHIQPINTRIINHHVYRHTYEPCFTSCEENVCSNVYDGPRCGY